MTPLQQAQEAIRQILDDRAATRAQLETLRHVIVHAADHSSAEDFRAAIRAAFDVAARPDARSFTTDSGVFRRSTAF